MFCPLLFLALCLTVLQIHRFSLYCICLLYFQFLYPISKPIYIAIQSFIAPLKNLQSFSDSMRSILYRQHCRHILFCSPTLFLSIFLFHFALVILWVFWIRFALHLVYKYSFIITNISTMSHQISIEPAIKFYSEAPVHALCCYCWKLHCDAKFILIIAIPFSLHNYNRVLRIIIIYPSSLCKMMFANCTYKSCICIQIQIAFDNMRQSRIENSWRI